MPASADELSYLEKKVLRALGKLKKASPEELKAATQRLGGGGERPGGQRRLRDPRRARGRRVERSGRAAARTAREGRAAGGRDRPARLAGFEVAPGAREGTGVRAARDRPDARGREDPRGGPHLEGRGGTADDGAPAVREMAAGRLPTL